VQWLQAERLTLVSATLDKTRSMVWLSFDVQHATTFDQRQYWRYDQLLFLLKESKIDSWADV